MSKPALCSIGRERRGRWRDLVFSEDDFSQAFKNVLIMAKGCRDRLEILEHVDCSPEQETHPHCWIVGNILLQMF